MKKGSILLSICLIIMSCVLLVGCNKQEQNSKIELNMSNYSDYIALNLEYGDVYYNNDYTYMFCNATVTTFASQSNIEFNNATIEFQLKNPSSTNTWTASRYKTTITDLSFDGTSKSTIALLGEINTSFIHSPNTNIQDIEIISVSGYVIVRG